MSKKRVKKSRFPDYDLIAPTEEVITFGTSVFIRKDKKALIIIFPAGQELHFKPEDEIKSAPFR